MVKVISIAVPCFNEQDNIKPMANELVRIMDQYKGKYDYEIIFRDNSSTDNSMRILREIASDNKKIKVISNARNYGLSLEKNTLIGRYKGDVIITLPCDFQEPPELIPEFIFWWEKGYHVVAGQKISSEEGRLKYSFRQLYYKIIAHYSENPQMKNVSGIFLMSRRIADLFYSRSSGTYFRYFITDLGCDVKLIPYKQSKRRAGKSSYNISRLLSFSINSLIQTSITPLRVATVTGMIFSLLSFIMGVVYFILKLIWWKRYSAGMAPMLIGMFFIGSIQLFFIGIVGEYVASILKKVTPSVPPLVKELINFDDDKDEYLYLHVDSE